MPALPLSPSVPASRLYINSWTVFWRHVHHLEELFNSDGCDCSRHDLVSSLSLGLSHGILNPASPGRDVYLFVNGIQPPQSRMDWAPFYSYLSGHRSPNGPEHQQELGFTGPFRTCRMAWFPKDKEGFSDLNKQTKHICGYPGNKPSLKLL